MKRILIISLIGIWSFASAQATITHLDDDMTSATISTLLKITDWEADPSTSWSAFDIQGSAVLTAGTDMGRTVHYNGAGLNPGNNRIAVLRKMDTPLDFVGRDLSIAVTMRLNDINPSVADAQWQLFGSAANEGDFKHLTVTIRPNGTFQLGVYRQDALGGAEDVTAASSSQNFIDPDDYFTLFIDRDRNGRWTVSRSDMGATPFIDITESKLITGGVTPFQAIRHNNKTGGWAEPATFYDKIVITSVPEPASALLLALGGGLLVARLRRK
jgi:hypothetical protein